MNRRWFLGASLAAVGSVFVPKYEGWYRAGSGLIVPEAPLTTLADLNELALDYYVNLYIKAWPSTPFPLPSGNLQYRLIDAPPEQGRWMTFRT